MDLPVLQLEPHRQQGPAAEDCMNMAPFFNKGSDFGDGKF